MAGPMQVVMVQREVKGKQQQWWRSGRLAIDSISGNILIKGQGMLNKYEMTFRPEMVESFTIDQITDTHTLAMMYGGGLLGYAIAALMGRWVKIPIIVLGQPMGGPDEKWARIRAVGFQPKKQLRALAQRISDALVQHGYRGMQPNLSDETLWKTNTAAIAAGCGIMIAIFLCIVGVAVVIGVANGNY